MLQVERLVKKTFKKRPGKYTFVLSYRCKATRTTLACSASATDTAKIEQSSVKVSVRVSIGVESARARATSFEELFPKEGLRAASAGTNHNARRASE